MQIGEKAQDNYLRIIAFDRRKRHYRAYRSGLTVDEIARKFECDVQTVANDICWVADNGGYSEMCLSRMTRQAVFLGNWADLDAAKDESWEAWHKSKLEQVSEKVKTITRGDEVTTEVTVEKRSSAGDPRFISSVTDTVYKQMVLAGFVSDGQGGRATVGAGDECDGEDDTVAIVEVGDRQQAAAVAGKRFCRLGVVEGAVVGRDESGEAVTVEAADGD